MSLTPRQREIFGWLNDAGYLSTEQLASRFGVSTQTIRRDINELSVQGLARRTHGGLSLSASQHNLSYLQRSANHVERKRRIGMAAVGMLEADATVFLGYGTTVADFARALPADLPLRVVTNNLGAVHALADKPRIETWVAGGRLRAGDLDVMGSASLDFLRRFRAHVAVCSAAGFDEDGAFYEFQPEEAELSRVLLSNSHVRMLLLDSSKYLHNAPCRVGTLHDVDHLFTDHEATDALASLPLLCERADVALHLC